MGTVAEQLVRRFKEYGVKYVYGVPSGSWLYYMEAMRKGGVEFVLVSNEASAGIMADVTARLTGTPGVCYGTVGPGASNLSTGVVNALLDRSPVIALTSEPPEKMIGRTVQMAIDQQAFFTPITKWTTRLAPDRVDQTLDKAMRIAQSEIPGPVHIGLPEDLGPRQAASIQTRVVLPAPAPAQKAEEAALSAMVEAFSKARKPVLAVGLSALRAELGKEIAEFAASRRIPIVLTPMAKGMISEDHPWYAGVLFHALSDQVAATHKQADLVLAVGYDPVEFNFEDWMPSVPLVNLDVVPADIDRLAYPQVVDVAGDVRSSFARLATAPSTVSEWDEKALAERRKAMFVRLAAPEGSFGPRAALQILREVLPEDGYMTCDVGAHTHLIGQQWRTPAPRLQLMTNGCSSMGFGVPAAIAVKLCMPDKKVACVTGDGGFLMMAGEMAAARRLKLPVVFVVFTDQNLELIRLKQSKKDFPTYQTLLHDDDCPTPNYVFGVPVLRADTQEEYRTALEQAFATDGPVIVEARIDSSEYAELILKKHK